jgi:hypothetical protein
MSRRLDRCCVLAAMLLAGLACLLDAQVCWGQQTGNLARGKWLSDRGPADPRPFDHTVLGSGLLNGDYFDWKNRQWIEHGISFGGYVSANVQWGSEGGPTHGISETLLLFGWEPVRDSNSSGRLVAGFAYDATFGRPTTREFANTQRLVETPNDLDTDPELTFATLGLLLWEHEWWTGPDRGWGLRAGQLYAPSYFGPARYLDDDRRFFMARPLAAAAGSQWVGYNDIGLGVNGIAWKAPLYVSLAVMDGKASRRFLDFASLLDARLLYLGEIGFEHDVDGPNEAAVRVTFSYLDVEPSENSLFGPGQSLMISGDKRFGGAWALAGRWSRSFDRLSADYRENFSLGVLWLEPVRRSEDLAGFGLFSGDPSDADLGWESGFEVFYRLQLTNAVSILPDLQYWRRDDPDGNGTRSWVWGIRSEFEF